MKAFAVSVLALQLSSSFMTANVGAEPPPSQAWLVVNRLLTDDRLMNTVPHAVGFILICVWHWLCWYAAWPHCTKYDVSINVSDLKNSKIVRDAAICDAAEWCVLQLFPYWLNHLNLISVGTVSHQLFLIPGFKRAWLWRKLSHSQLPANSMCDCVWT